MTPDRPSAPETPLGRRATAASRSRRRLAWRAFAMAALFHSSTLTGCALTVDTIQLDYLARTQSTPYANAPGVTVTVEAEDRRSEAKVGSKKNGYGMEMAEIVSAENVASIVQRSRSPRRSRIADST